MLQVVLPHASGKDLLTAVLDSADTALSIQNMALFYWNQQTAEEGDDDATARIDAGREQIKGCSFYFDQFFSAHKVVAEALRNWRTVADAYESMGAEEDKDGIERLADNLAHAGAALQDALYTLTDAHDELAMALEELPENFESVMLETDEGESWEDLPIGEDDPDEDEAPPTKSELITEAAGLLTAGHIGRLRAETHMTLSWMQAFARLLNLDLHAPEFDETLEPEEEILDVDEPDDDWGDSEYEE